jgi:hypothetical protein
MNMKKLLGLGFAAAMFASQAQAAFIWNVTGSDMAGIEVTATFADTSTETLNWADLGGDKGGVTGSGWSLSVDGDTIVPNDPLAPMAGVWVLEVGQVQLSSLWINLGTAFVFDTEFGDLLADGSGPGRAFVSSSPIGFTFMNPAGSAELFSALSLFDITGSTMFAVDTDAVPTPATLSLMGLALLGLVAGTRRKKA